MFDWDPRKAKSNRLKHGVSFEEAATAFLDPVGLNNAFKDCSKKLRGEARDELTNAGVLRSYVEARQWSATKHVSFFSGLYDEEKRR